MRSLLAFALLVVAGCGPVGDATPLPDQDEAVGIIWRGYYQSKAPPRVYWRRDRCGEPNGIYGPLPYCTFSDGGERVAGVEIDTDAWVEVGAPTDGRTFSSTALAHELLHAAIGDLQHVQADKWSAEVPAADGALRALGL